MGERKVLNKYFPPDFDPKLIPRRRMPKNKQIEVRMMLPFSIQCNACGEFMYQGKKFNSRKEDVLDEDYFGIRIYRFYIRCSMCSNEITFKTDPKNGDYATEHGCKRNFEPWRERAADEKEAVKAREEEEKGDSMKALENRTLDSKREMDIIDALDEIKAINQRHAKVDTDALLQKVKQTDDDDTKKDILDEAEIQSQMEAFRKRKLEAVETTKPAKQPKPDDNTLGTSSTTNLAPLKPSIKVKAKPTTAKPKTTNKPTKATPTPAAPVALVGSYSDSDSS
ncbi:Coiled-coil domain-containing protein 94 [Aphanomyces cochlioides]|nr:Coiled-coil domain-containing protein 94 [Aphanomyces cochlioides]